MKLKYFLITAILTIAVLCFWAVPASAQTTDIQAQIAQLKAQIQSLLQQITELQTQQQGPPAQWCHTFNSDLGFANSGSAEVWSLHVALEMEGISYTPDTGNIYTEATASAVAEFQEKYASEILAPYGLTRGTGYVSRTTRVKLNALYGCGAKPACSNLWWFDNTNTTCQSQRQFCGTYMYQGLRTFQTQQECLNGVAGVQAQPSITVTSPNGGETWQIGSTQTVQWTSTGIPSTANIALRLVRATSPTLTTYLARNISNDGSESVVVPSTIQPGTFNVEVMRQDIGQVATLDSSDTYITIISTTFCIIDMDCWSTTGPASRCVSGVCIPPMMQNLFINGQSSNGPVIVSQGYSATLTWTSSNATSCIASSCEVSSSLPVTGSCPAGNSADGEWSGAVALSGTKITSSITKAMVYGITCTGLSGETRTNSLGVQPSTAQPSITVTSPNGGEVWKIGETHNIAWTTAGIPSGDTVDIVLAGNQSAGSSNYMLNVASGVSALSGSYAWTIPNTIPVLQNNYRIIIEDGSRTNHAIDTSDNYFTISAAGQQLSASCSASPNPANVNQAVTFMSSASGGTGVYSSSWSGNCSGPGMTCVKTFSSSGTYPVHLTVASGGQTATADCSVVVQASTQPSITVTSPNGGEVWPIGSTQTVQWTSAGLPSTANLTLRLVRTTNLAITTAIAQNVLNDGLESVVVPSTIQPGTYKLEVIRHDIGQVATSDMSDTYFSVTAATCSSEWHCSAWNTCTNNQQTRDCKDANECGTTTGKPAEVRVCTSGTLISHYSFENNFRDVTGTYNGTAIGNPTFVDGVAGGIAVRLDGNDYISLGRELADKQTFGGENGAITISAWVKPDNIGRYNFLTSDVGGFRYLSVGKVGSSGQLISMIKNTTTNTNYWPTSTNTINLTQWTHVAFIFDGGSGYKYYINGVLSNEESNPSWKLFNYKTSAYIGKGSDYTSYFTGLIDEFKIWDYALSGSEIQAEYYQARLVTVNNPQDQLLASVADAIARIMESIKQMLK